MCVEKATFSFGKNWEDFVKHYLSEKRIEIARAHMLNLLEMADIRNRYFLDVGCGSGLHSLAALKSGANRIVSFDVDQQAVRTTEKVREIHGNPANWKVVCGSILDRQFISNLEPADIVYSWGVLHHTGDMWKAIENSAGLMKNDGLLYIAIYTTETRSPYWLRVKKRYNRASETRKRFMEYCYIVKYTLAPQLVRLKNPFQRIREHKEKRGMAYITDVRDWLGGYPYEHAKMEEVLRFCRKRLGLELINIKTGEANTEYVFARR